MLIVLVQSVCCGYHKLSKALGSCQVTTYWRQEFNPAVEDWISYAEQLEFYFAANEVKEADKQRAVLFSVCGVATYKLIKNLLAPAKPTEAAFKDIV